MTLARKEEQDSRFLKLLGTALTKLGHSPEEIIAILGSEELYRESQMPVGADTGRAVEVGPQN